jgi:hypothetical protein
MRLIGAHIDGSLDLTGGMPLLVYRPDETGP